MKLFYILEFIFGFIYIIKINAFIKNIPKLQRYFSESSYNSKRICRTNKIYSPGRPIYHMFENKISQIKLSKIDNNKFTNFIKLIRPKSIFPTLLLIFSGGWIMNPSFKNLLHSKNFIISSINIIFILMSSMVINDIYDIEIDKINNPTRPIPSGKIKKSEAILLNFLLIATTEYLNIFFLPHNLQLIIHAAIIIINLYTPILKKIFLIKNISCAALVAFTIFFSGLSSITGLISKHRNLGFLKIASSLVFYGSLSNEILLDIRDYDGDKSHKIITIPVLYGKDNARFLVKLLTYLNIISNVLSLYYLTNLKSGFLLLLFISPLLYNLHKLKPNNYTKKNIEILVNQNNIPLLLTLSYLCFLSYYKN